jgi:curved DNA-binding protein CbpA
VSPDAFALFDLPRQPWLDATELRNEFHRRSATAHPDAGGDADQFARLNAAHQTLREPATRLRHLLELESPETLAAPQQIPPPLADRFMRVAAVRQSCAAFLAKHRATTSPLALALLASEHTEQIHALEAALADLATAHTDSLARLRASAADWQSHLSEIAMLQAEFSYLEKWTAQLRESQLALAIALPSHLKSEI